MSETPKLRLVRCPKCWKLLPEHPRLTVYECGGCGTVLRAKEILKSKSTSSDLVSAEKPLDEMSGEGRGCDGRNEIDFDRIDKRSMEEKMAGMMSKSKRRVRNGDLNDTTISPAGWRNGTFGAAGGTSDPNGVRLLAGSVEKSAGEMKERDLAGGQDARGLPARSSDGGSCKSPGGKSVAYAEYVCSVHQQVGLCAKQNEGKDEVAARSVRRWKESSEEGSVESGSNFQRMQVSARADQVGIGAQSKFGDIGVGSSYAVARSQREVVRSHRTVEHFNDEGSRLGSFYGDPRVCRDYQREASYVGKGQSNYHPNSLYGYGKLRHSFQGSGGSDLVSDLELERAQLLQRYHELKDQLSRTGDASQGRRAPSPEGSIQEEGLGKRGSPSQPTTNNSIGFSYADHGQRSVPFQGDDPYSPLLGMTPRPHPHPRLTHKYLSLQSMGSLPADTYEFNHHQHGFFHYPKCSCSHCFINSWHAHKSAPSRRSRSIVTGQVYTRHGSYGPVRHERRGPDFPARDSSHINWSCESNSDAGGFADHRPRRLLISDQNRHFCTPIAGGAPFMLCCNCFELLKLPRKLMRMEKNQQKLQCGACSARMALNLENKIAIAPIENQSSSTNANNSSVKRPMGDDSRNSHESSASSSVKVESCFNENGLSFESVKSQPSVQSQGLRQDSHGAESSERLSPSHSHSSRDEARRDTVLLQSNVANSAEMLVKTNLVPPPPGSPLQDHFDYSLVLRKLEVGKSMNLEEQVEPAPEEVPLFQRPVDTASMATEIDVNSSEFIKNSTSEDSAEVYGQVGMSKGSRSSSSAFMKAIRDLNGSTHRGSNGIYDVYVNGQLILPRELRRAEKQAGPISPGCYWYDSKAGFWGAIGNRCLGIIPPFIPEFGFPMPVNCSGGGTAVYVNGRELHTSDLVLLGSRGLPTTSDKFYVVEISGKVFDEDTGELVARLGKLAPTVEKTKQGFGMRVPEIQED